MIKDVLIEILTYNFLGESKPAYPVAESLRVARRFGCPSFNCLTPLGNIVSGILVYTTCGILRRFKSCTSWGGSLGGIIYQPLRFWILENVSWRYPYAIDSVLRYKKLRGAILPLSAFQLSSLESTDSILKEQPFSFSLGRICSVSQPRLHFGSQISYHIQFLDTYPCRCALAYKSAAL